MKDDNPYYVNRVAAPSLISQLDHAGISWKAYLQGLPHPGYQGICYPANCNGEPDKGPLTVTESSAGYRRQAAPRGRSAPLTPTQDATR